VCDAGQRPRSQDGPFPVEQEWDRKGLLKLDGVRCPNSLEEALGCSAGTKQHVVAAVERLATMHERRRAPAEARSGIENRDRVPIAGEAAGGGHSREPPSDNYDARHPNLQAAVSRSREFPSVGSEAREGRLS
jgi:hypothetical protein